MGSNSSFTAAAVSNGIAPSEVVGLWAGSRSLDPKDGLLVVGGYDESRIAGNFVNFTVASDDSPLNCPLQVQIASIRYNEEELLNDDGSLTACIEPYNHRSIFPPTITTAFANATNQSTVAYPVGLRYSASTRPVGALTITLSNGYSTTVTNEELFTLLRGSDERGQYGVIDNTVVEAGIQDTRQANTRSITPALGSLFLTFNYLLVDYRRGVFGLAPAVASNITTAPLLRAVCDPLPTESAGGTSSSENTAGPNVGLIAGSTIGRVIGLAAIVALLYWRYRHREPSLKQQETGKSLQESSPPVSTNYPHHPWPSPGLDREAVELLDRHEPVEIGGSRAILP